MVRKAALCCRLAAVAGGPGTVDSSVVTEVAEQAGVILGAAGTESDPSCRPRQRYVVQTSCTPKGPAGHR